MPPSAADLDRRPQPVPTGPGPLTAVRSAIDRVVGFRVEILAVLGAVVVLAVAGMATAASVGAGLGMTIAAAAVGIVIVGLRDPVVAVVLVLLASFFRIVPQLQSLPLQPFTLACAGLIFSIAIAVVRRTDRLPRLGAIELLMGLFLLWNVLSAIAPHELEPINSETGELISLRSFIQTGVLIPFVLYVVGRFVVARRGAVTTLLWVVVGFTAYSALVSILQFAAPALVWPRYIVDNPGWGGERAVGIFNQPVVNGLVLVIGFVVALHLATRDGMSGRRRLLLNAIACASLIAIYLTRTRATWLALALVLVAGALLSPYLRRSMLAVLAVIAVFIAVNWQSFVGSDRETGGVGSVSEVDDRLNIMATSIWGIAEKPLTGWGIGRFQQLNTFYHQQWAPDVNWVRGLGIASHENELGIGAEVGLPALLVWVAVFVLISVLLVKAVRRPGPGGTEVRELAVVATLAMLVWIVTGTTVDLRYFEFGGALVMLLAGMGVGAAQLSWESERPEQARS